MSSTLGTSLAVDPDLLRARLEAITDSRARERVNRVVDGALACLGRLKGIDFLGLEREAGATSARELWAGIEGLVAQMWLAVEELSKSVRPLVRAHEDLQPKETPGAELDLDLGGPKPAAAPKRVPTVEERINESAWAMSFVLQGELDGFRGRVPVLTRVNDGWELVSAVQDHVGHLNSAVTAIVTSIFTSLPGGSAVDPEASQSLDLFSSRELRTRVFALRDEVIAIEAGLRARSASGWLQELERVRALVDTFMFSPAFAWMRAGDKRAFLEHQRALADIMAMWSPLRAEPARRAVETLARYLEALEVINQRECLRNYDRAALARVVAHLTEAEASGDASRRPAIAKGLVALAEAQGRDRGLDELLAQTLDPSKPPPLAAILERAKEVLKGLG